MWPARKRSRSGMHPRSRFDYGKIFFRKARLPSRQATGGRKTRRTFNELYHGKVFGSPVTRSHTNSPRCLPPAICSLCFRRISHCRSAGHPRILQLSVWQTRFENETAKRPFGSERHSIGFVLFQRRSIFHRPYFSKGKEILRPIHRRSKSPMYFALIGIPFNSESYLKSDWYTI